MSCITLCVGVEIGSWLSMSLSSFALKPKEGPFHESGSCSKGRKNRVVAKQLWTCNMNEK